MAKSKTVPQFIAELKQARQVILIVDSRTAYVALKVWGLTLPIVPVPVSRWRTEYAGQFKGKRVVIMSSNTRYAELIALSLQGISAVKIVRIDAGDWILEQKRTIADLAKLVEQTLVWAPSEQPESLAEMHGLEKGGALHRAEKLIRTFLAESPQPVNEVRAAAGNAGISAATLRRAADRLGIQRQKRGGTFGGDSRWYWSLP